MDILRRSIVICNRHKFNRNEVKSMSEKEKQVVEKLKEAIPKMSDFDKGYILGKVESMADEKKDNKKESEG